MNGSDVNMANLTGGKSGTKSGVGGLGDSEEFAKWVSGRTGKSTSGKREGVGGVGGHGVKEWRSVGVGRVAGLGVEEWRSGGVGEEWRIGRTRSERSGARGHETSPARRSGGVGDYEKSGGLEE